MPANEDPRLATLSHSDNALNCHRNHFESLGLKMALQTIDVLLTYHHRNVYELKMHHGKQVVIL